MNPSSNTPQEADPASFDLDTVSRDIDSLADASSKPGLYSLSASELPMLCHEGLITREEARAFLGLK